MAREDVMNRVGHGYDLHRFDLGSGPAEICIGGIKIHNKHTVVAHSDGDVLIHALCDALLGAMALGDLGDHFPDSDPQWRGAAGASLLQAVAGMMKQGGWSLGNADLTVICESPKIAPHRSAMRAAIGAALGVSFRRISIKATTSEGVGPIGRGEALAAHAVVLLCGDDDRSD